MAKSIAQSLGIRTRYNYDPSVISHSTGLSCPESTRTKQSFAEEVDINTIVRKFGITGLAPVTPFDPAYGDFTGVTDYQAALHLLMEADEAFFNLPSDLRKKFDNDPANYVDFCSNPANLPEMRELGLANPLVDAAPAANGLPAPASGDDSSA